MSERFGPPPPDEPIIGAGYPPPSAPPPPQRQQRFPLPDDSAPAYEEPYAEDDDESEYGEDDEYYDDEYEFYEDTPARQPMFYVFIGMAALIGGLVIFLLFTLFTGGGKEEVKPAAGFNVSIDFPTANSRVEIGKSFEVSVNASSNEPITRFELLVGDRSVDQIAANSTAVDKGFKAVGRLRAQFNQRGDYDIVVRVTSSSGATKNSSAVHLIAVESVGDKPAVVKGKAQTDVNVRTGPGETYELVKTLKAGDEVSIIGKTRDKEWLLIDLDGQQRWVKRSAILEQDSLDLVKTTEPTPRPEPTATNTSVPSPSPSPSRSPSPGASSPDFAPTNAVLIDGGKTLRVTVQNLSANNFNGSLVVGVSGVSPGTLTLAFAVNIPASATTTVDFPLDTPVTTQKTAKVTVDPDNAIKELNEDNNTANFGLGPPIESPELSIAVALQSTTLNVTISNAGGPLATTNATVKVTLGAQSTSLNTSLAINKGGTQTVSVARPQGTGQATVEVIVGSQTLASTTITFP
jgi:uncharacterized protein YraI